MYINYLQEFKFQKRKAMKNNIYSTILDLIKHDLYTDFPEIKEYSQNKLFRTIIRNYRPRNQGGRGLYLSVLGFTYLSKKIQNWSFDYIDRDFTNHHILFLERSERYPYYYSGMTQTFHTFCPKLAFRLKIANGDLNIFIKSEKS